MAGSATTQRIVTFLAAVLLAAGSAWAGDDPKARLGSAPEPLHTLTFAPLLLSGGSHLTLVSPSRWSPVIRRLSHSLEEVHTKYTELFGVIPPLTTSIRLMDEEDFFKSTGAPRWTNALYYKEEIIIPLPQDGHVDWENLLRAVKHEYTHAVVHGLSGGRCPGWLDEGLAQWAEGQENPALRPALLRRLRAAGPVPLTTLQGGFTKLDAKIVPAAYAQSLYLTQTIIRSYGFTALKLFFAALKKGQQRSAAFRGAFRLSEPGFETAMGKTLTQWEQAHTSS